MYVKEYYVVSADSEQACLEKKYDYLEEAREKMEDWKKDTLLFNVCIFKYTEKIEIVE